MDRHPGTTLLDFIRYGESLPGRIHSVASEAQNKTGMTTSSRATALVGLAVINAAKALKEDLKTKSLKELIGKSYKGQYACNWTTKPGIDVDEQITHYSYDYAAQVCILNDNGRIVTSLKFMANVVYLQFLNFEPLNSKF